MYGRICEKGLSPAPGFEIKGTLNIGGGGGGRVRVREKEIESFFSFTG